MAVENVKKTPLEKEAEFISTLSENARMLRAIARDNQSKRMSLLPWYSDPEDPDFNPENEKYWGFADSVFPGEIIGGFRYVAELDDIPQKDN